MNHTKIAVQLLTYNSFRPNDRIIRLTTFISYSFALIYEGDHASTRQATTQV